MDLPADLGTDRLTWRRLGVLLQQLPRESATMRAVHGEAVAWGTVEHLLATVIDVLVVGNWQRGGNKRAPRPKPLPRPGTGPKRRSPERIREALLEQRARLRREVTLDGHRAR